MRLSKLFKGLLLIWTARSSRGVGTSDLSLDDVPPVNRFLRRVGAEGKHHSRASFPITLLTSICS